MMAANSNLQALSMEEDDDIEMLRIAALKSLHNKPKEQERPAPLGHFPMRPLEHLVQGFQFHQRMAPQMHRNIPPSGYPYHQPHLHPMHASFLPATNVQLSPRSMAFVAQNNDIIMRRNRSPSPRRWSSSRSTSPRSPTRYRSRSPDQKRAKFTPPVRKSRTRSPAHTNSLAPIRRRSSKSPVGQRNSPKYNQRNQRFNRNRPENSGANTDTKRFNNQQGDYKRKRNGSFKPHGWANKQDSRDKCEKNVKNEKSEKLADKSEKVEEPSSSTSSKELKSEAKHDESVSDTKAIISKKTTKAPAESTSGEKREKTQEEIEDELLASSNDESDLDMDTIEDGLDLFASEESESENEGRFKLSSSSSNNKKSVPAPSFSKLGKSSEVKELRELEPSSSRYGNDRNRHHSGNSGKRDFDHRRKETNNKYSESRRRTPPMPTKVTKEVSKEVEKKKEEKEKIMFKATFKTVESTVNIVKKEEEKPKPVKDDYRVVLVRRKLPAKEEEPTTTIPTKSEDVKSGKSSNIISMKKPIHSRLGAIVGTKKETGVDKKSAIEKIKKLILKNLEQNAFMRISWSKKLLKKKEEML